MNLNLEYIHNLYPRIEGDVKHQVVGISEAVKAGVNAKAQKLHSEFISFLVRSEGDYYITPANNHDNIYSLVQKMIKANYDTINFAIVKIDKNGKEELLFPDYNVSEFLVS